MTMNACQKPVNGLGWRDMDACPINHLTTPPEQIPARIAKLPVVRGFPVPWFVQKTPDGEYDFRVMDSKKWVRAVKEGLCWTCGEKLGKYKTFVAGPMCALNRTSGEPPSHLECARYAATHCPFLTIPHMKRRENNLPEHKEMAGIGLKRNPGATMLWTTTSYGPFRDGKGGMLITFSDPTGVEWYAEGRVATRQEVQASVDSSLPLLREQCDKGATPAACAAAHQELDRMVIKFQQYLPA